MFTYLPSSRQRNWFLALLILWALFLFGGFLLGTGSDPGHRIPTWTRMASSVMLVAAGWSWYGVGRHGRTARFLLFIAVGMTFGLLGDLVLAGLLPGGRNVLAGIAAFGVGHIFYIAAALWLGNRFGLDAPRPRWSALGVWLLIGAVAWYVVVFRGQEAAVLHWAALPYALLLASTTGFATGLALQRPAFTPFAVGAALFLISDLILAAQLFNGLTFPLIGDVIWLTYGPGQMLIVYTSGTAVRLFSRSVKKSAAPHT